MIVIGVDAHKRTHTLVAVDAVTGAGRGQRTVPASDAGALDALRSPPGLVRIGCGQWRTAGMYRQGLNALCWAQGNG